MDCMKDENGVEWWTRTTLEAIQHDIEEAYRHGAQGGSYDWPGMGEVTITENGEAFLKPNLPIGRGQQELRGPARCFPFASFPLGVLGPG